MSTTNAHVYCQKMCDVTTMPPVACYGDFSRSPRAFLAFLGHLLCPACESTAVFGLWRALACRLPAMRRNVRSGATTYSSHSTYVIAFHWLLYTGKNRCFFFSSGRWHGSYTTSTVSFLLVSACTSRLVDTLKVMDFMVSSARGDRARSHSRSS